MPPGRPRPRVLHVARDWVRPSEGFVEAVVRTTTATQASLAYGHHHGTALPPRSVRVPDGGRAQRYALLGVAAAQRAQVLHAHFGYWARPVAAVAARLGRPWVVALHGHDLLVEGCPDAARADLVVVPSRFLADAASRAGVRDERLRVVPSGLALDELPFRVRRARADGRVVVTFAGRYAEKKGVLDAAAALARAQAEVPSLVVRFVGHGPLEGRLRSELASLGVRAELLDGSVPGAVRAALAQTDLLLTASRTAPDGDAETLGLVNLEAHAMGVPVVTTRHGGIPEAVSPDAAVLVPEGSVPDLAAAVVALARDPGRWAAMGEAGRAHVVLRHELGARVADLEALWQALAARAPLPTPPPPRAALPRVSVVVVTRDRRALLSQALDALAAQTYPADLTEVVVVDNASRDGSADDLVDRPVTVLTAAEHVPVAAARNAAVSHATGSVVAFTDDDCRPTPTWLEALVAGLRSGTSLVQGRTLPDPAQTVEPLSRTQWTPAEGGLYETCGLAYDTAVFRAHGGFDEGFAAQVAGVLGRFARYPFGEDTELAWRVLRAGGTARFAATALVHHEVFAPDPSLLLRRSVVGAAWPVLVRRTPEVGGLLLGGVVLGPHRRAVLLALAGVALAAVDRRAVVLAVPWAWRVVRPTRRGRQARLRAAPVLALRDLVETGALAYGSARARRLVL